MLLSYQRKHQRIIMKDDSNREMGWGWANIRFTGKYGVQDAIFTLDIVGG